jgi:hypothetical protein
MQRSDGIVGCLVNKDPITNATLETILFHYGCCLIGTSSIVVGYTLSFYFLLHFHMFWYCVVMGIT